MKPISELGEYLVEKGLIQRIQLDKALELQSIAGGRLGTALLELNAIGEGTLLEAVGHLRRTKTVGAGDLKTVPYEVLKIVPVKIVRRFRLVPVERKGRQLVLAAMEPVDPFVEEEIGLLTSCLVRTVIGLELRILEALNRYYRVPILPRMVSILRRLDRPGKVTPPVRPAAAPAAVGPPAAKSPAPKAPVPPAPSERKLLPLPSLPRSPGEDVTWELDRADVPGALPAVPEPEPAIQFVELDAASLAQIYGREPGSTAAVPEEVPLLTATDPEERLDQAAAAFQDAGIRDEIGDVLLAFCEPYLKRRALFMHRKEMVAGWRGAGDGVQRSRLRKFEISDKEPSVFLGLKDGSGFWLGPLPTLVANRKLGACLGAAPKGCVVLPVVLRGRVACFLYGDNGADGVSQAPIAELRRLVGKAGLAFEVYILKNKIRLL